MLGERREDRADRSACRSSPTARGASSARSPRPRTRSSFPRATRSRRRARAGREFVVIVEGAAEVRRRGRKINALGAGDFLGEIALVSRGPRTATVRTTPADARARDHGLAFRARSGACRRSR